MKAKLYSIYKRFMTWIGDLMVATQPPNTKAKQIIEMQNIIQVGDVICRKYTYYMDSYFIPGEYTHSGIVISKDEIIHSIAEGVQFIHPIDFIKDTDGFIILRPKYLVKEDIKTATATAIKAANDKVEYDFLFNDPTKLYCHELTATCLNAAGIEVGETILNIGVFPFKFKRVITLADNLIEICNTVYVFNRRQKSIGD